MKRFILLLIAILFFSTSAFSQDISKKLEQRYSTLQSWSADFEQSTFVEMLGRDVVKNGNISVRRPDKIRIEYLTEPSKIYTSNGKKLWVYKKDEDTAWQFDKPQKIISQEALSVLNGLTNLSAVFDIVTGLKETEGFPKIKNTALTKIFLIPKNQDSVLKITLGIEPKTLTIKEAVLFNTSGNVAHYLFSNIVFDKPLDESLFTLPAEPRRKIIKK